MRVGAELLHRLIGRQLLRRGRSWRAAEIGKGGRFEERRRGGVGLTEDRALIGRRKRGIVRANRILVVNGSADGAVRNTGGDLQRVIEETALSFEEQRFADGVCDVFVGIGWPGAESAGAADHARVAGSVA